MNETEPVEVIFESVPLIALPPVSVIVVEQLPVYACPSSPVIETERLKSKFIVGVNVLGVTAIAYTTLVIGTLDETAEVKPVEVAVIVNIPELKILISVTENTPEAEFPLVVPVQDPVDNVSTIG